MSWQAVALLGAGLWLPGPGRPASNCKATIQQIDTQRFPEVRVSVLVTDSAGDPLPSASGIDLKIFEEGREVTSKRVDAFPVHVVLVIDRSGSMKETGAFEMAKEAAIAYIDSAPLSFQIALASFSDSTRVDADFTSDRQLLRARIGALQAVGATALQDGIGKALQLLREKPGRRVILVLTDGKERPGRQGGSRDYPGPEGLNTLLGLARAQEVSISTIGLGNEVDKDALSQFSATRGQQLYAYGPEQLRALFLNSVSELKKEQFLTYRSSLPPNGRPLNLEVRVEGSDLSLCRTNGPPPPVLPGLIPHVKGDVAPYGALVLLLLMLPATGAASGSFRSTRRFRRQHVRRVEPGSRLVGMQDPNKHPLAVGEPVVMCPDPGCRHPHHVRSWRMNGCKCMWKPQGGHAQGSGSFCYSRNFPAWIRRSLDWLTRGHESDTGRTWKCRCAGDADGY